MPITFDLEKDGNRNCYIRRDYDSRGNEILHRECEMRVVVTNADGLSNYTLLDDDGNTNIEFNAMLNIDMVNQGKSNNTRRNTAQVLAKFYAFIILMGYSIYNLGNTEIHQLVAFFQGTGPLQCTAGTVNAYLTVVRSYFVFLSISCPALFSKRTFWGDSNILGYKPLLSKFVVNLPNNPHADERVPKYITFDQYLDLIRLANKYKDWTAVILIHLMFRYGMRLGECLGLTLEDVTVTRINGKDVPTLIIRNRMTDKSFQRAKCKITPQSQEDYNNVTYIEQWRNDDFAHYYLVEDDDELFVSSLNKFITHTHEAAEREHPDNYRLAEADVVYSRDWKKKGLKKNHYVFLNRLGKPLSADLWGQTLKRYYMELGIPIDTIKKLNNLSHRLRHGFAMMHAHSDPPTPMNELRLMMHHKHISSTAIYYNPTDEERFEKMTEMQKSILKSNPELAELLSNLSKEE